MFRKKYTSLRETQAKEAENRRKMRAFSLSERKSGPEERIIAQTDLRIVDRDLWARDLQDFSKSSDERATFQDTARWGKLLQAEVDQREAKGETLSIRVFAEIANNTMEKAFAVAPNRAEFAGAISLLQNTEIGQLFDIKEGAKRGAIGVTDTMRARDAKSRKKVLNGLKNIVQGNVRQGLSETIQAVRTGWRKHRHIAFTP